MKWTPLAILLLIITSCSGSSDAIQDQEIENEQIIRIYSDSIGWDGKLPCEITYAGKKYKAAIKYRGGISSQYPKHSMTVEFEEKVTLGNLPTNDDFIFNASYIDKTFQRHKLSYDIFRLMNSENKAPRCDYLPIYLNDKYIGLYVIMEKVNGSWLGFDKARIVSENKVYPNEKLSNKSFGHTGFTGTMFWVDPEKDLILVFLTNRVYPNRNKGSFYEVDVRNKLFEIIL